MGLVLGVREGEVSYTQELQKQDKMHITVISFDTVYIVLSDYLNEPESSILASVGIPGLRDTLNGAYCNNLQPKHQHTVLDPSGSGVLLDLWHVAAGFSSNINPNEKEDPDKKHPTFKWTGENEDERLEKDAITNRPIVTGADEPILIEGPVCYPIFEVTRYERYPINPMIFLEFVNHTNLRSFMGAPTGCALMMPIESEREDIGGIAFAKTVYRIKFKMRRRNGNGVFLSDTFMAEPLSEGYYYRKAAGDLPEIFIGKGGEPKKVNLNLNGTLLPLGANPRFLKFNRYAKVDFSRLSLKVF